LIAVERLTAEDQVMLWPDEIWPQEIGAVAILDGTSLLDKNGRFLIDNVRQAIGARLHLAPRFRQLLYRPRRGLGGPLWVDDAAFDLTEHVRVIPLAAPRDEAALLVAAEQLIQCRLDRSRPLWEMCFLPGLPDNEIALVVRMHHAIADGIAGVATIGAFLDASAGATTAPARAWTPAPYPASKDLLADNLRTHVSRAGRTFSALARPVGTMRRARAVWSAIYNLATAEPTAPTSLNHRVGPGRRLAFIRSSLEQVKQIAHAHHATVNDVLLSVTAGGLRGLLRSRCEPVDDVIVRIDVPVTLRPVDQRSQARGNMIGQFVVTLPIAISDAASRLEQIATQTAARKAEVQPSVGTVLHSRIGRRAMLKALDRQPVNVTSADLPGPLQPLYLAGARLLEAFPLLPLIANVSLGIGALSYAGQFHVAVIADRDAYPDLDAFVASAQQDLQSLAARAT
jgi:diacylglycerol O-acyltransferase